MATAPPRALDPQPRAQMAPTLRVVPPSLGPKWVGVGVIVLIGALLIRQGSADEAIPALLR